MATVHLGEEPSTANAPPITTLIFDLDGVLIDLCEFHRDLYIDSFNACATAAGGEATPGGLLTKDVHSDFLEGLSTRAKLRECRALFPGASWDDEAVYVLKQARTQAALEQMVFQPRTRVALEAARAAGLRLACYTNSIRATLDAVLAGLGVAHLFEATMSNEEAPAAKPCHSFSVAYSGDTLFSHAK